MFRDTFARINSRAVGLRMARREVSRNKLQSFLVIFVISMPIAVGALALTYSESTKPTPEERIEYYLGKTQARVTSSTPPSKFNYQSPLEDSVFFMQYSDGSSVEWQEQTSSALVDPRKVISGYSWLTERTSQQAVKTKTGQAQLPVLEVEAWNKNLEGRFFNFKGKAPTNNQEALVTQAALKRLGVEIGGNVEFVDTNTSLKIVGTIEDSKAGPKTPEIFVQPKPVSSKNSDLSGTAFYAVGNKDITWKEITKLNTLGIGVLSKSVILNPPAKSEIPLVIAGGMDTSNSFGRLIQLIVLLPVLLLPVVILTGSAFSFGARRQVRSIAVMSSLGAKKSTLRFITVANGLWLGLLGGLVGSVVGLGISYFVLPALTDGSKISLPGFHVPWALLTMVALSGALIGALVSIIPAFTAAKVEVLSTLRGSRRDGRARKRSGIFGLIMIGIGVAGLLVCLPFWVYLEAPETKTELGWETVASLQQLAVLLATFSSFVAIFGFMLGSSWLLVFARFLFRRLGTAANFATNDLVFNRKRFTAVISSVIATSFIAATVLSFFYTMAKPGVDRYRAVGEVNQIQFLTQYNENKLDSESELDAYISSRSNVIKQYVKSASDIAPIKSAGAINVHRSYSELGYRYYDSGELMIGAEGEIPYAKINFEYLCPDMEASPDHDRLNSAYSIDNWRLADKILNEEKYLDCNRITASSPSDFVVGGPEDLRILLGGRIDSAAEAALSRGEAVVFNKGFLSDGKLQLDWHPSGLVELAYGNSFLGNIKDFPAKDVKGNLVDFTKPSRTEIIQATISSSPNQVLNFVIPPATADKLGLEYHPLMGVVNYADKLTVEQKDELFGSFPEGFTLEEGPTLDPEAVAWLLAAIAGLLVLSSTAIALGLSQIESRADHSTLWSVGASRFFRSRVVSFQALVLSLVGTIFGSTVGFLLVYVLSSSFRAETQIPAPQSLFLVVGIPLIAALGFLVGTPKRYKYGPRLALD